MAAGVDAVAVFWEDATYDLVTWDNIDDLFRPFGQAGRYVAIAIYHVQNPGDFPNALVEVGQDRIGLRSTPTHLVCHSMIDPPGGSEKVTESTFQLGSPVQHVQVPYPTPAAAGVGAMQMVFHSLPEADPTYDDLNNRANAAVNGLRFAAVPSSGTY